MTESFRTPISASNRLLLIDDDPDVAALFRRILKGVNPHIELHWHLTAEEGRGAIEREGPFALIVCDQQLGGPTTGLELWRSQLRTPNTTPFVMISSVDPKSFFALVGSGNAAPLFLPKPILPERCRELLSRFVPDAKTDPQVA